MGFLVLVVIAAAVVVLVVRAGSARNGPRLSGRPERQRPQRARRPQPPSRPVAPDDDPEFLRSLDRWMPRDDGAAS